MPFKIARLVDIPTSNEGSLLSMHSCQHWLFHSWCCEILSEIIILILIFFMHRHFPISLLAIDICSLREFLLSFIPFLIGLGVFFL